MEGEDGLQIIRIDFITGDYKIQLKQTLYKNQGLSIKKCIVINPSFLLIFAEREP